MEQDVGRSGGKIRSRKGKRKYIYMKIYIYENKN